MSARFAEECRESALDLLAAEAAIEARSINDGRSTREICLTCEQDIYIGVFFDGTNNNKYRDTVGRGHSNVARLYEAFPGTPAKQTPPTLLPRVLDDGGTEPRPVTPDLPLKGDLPPETFNYHRKIYIPGLGTPHPDVGDDGKGIFKTAGLAAALVGQARLDWALLQLCNQVHMVVLGSPIHEVLDMGALTGARKRTGRRILVPDFAEVSLEALLDLLWTQVGQYRKQAIADLLDSATKRLSAAVTYRGPDTLPKLRKIRLSVFGFSRGAAEARAWVNLVVRRWGATLGGLPLQIDFLGIFDTVASVGLVQAAGISPKQGHDAWAAGENLVVPGDVKRCVHLVAALEVRGSFPLDSVCMGGTLPLNCKEVVYPGVHSDVGGGYPPEDQGRCLPAGAEGDSRKMSQISLAQMYREARMAGVPLVPPGSMIGDLRSYFAIHPDLRRDFNAYVEATRTGRRPAPTLVGRAAVTNMFPTETQPSEQLLPLMRRHAEYMLQWRRKMLETPGRIAALPGLQAMRVATRWQDAEDIRGAEAELRKELAFLHSSDPEKFEHVDDPLFDILLERGPGSAQVNVLVVALALIAPLDLRQYAAKTTLQGRSLAREASTSMMQAKQRQWDSWLRASWYSKLELALGTSGVQAVHDWHENYVHDSRAWFKAMMVSDRIALAPDDEDWFTLGGRLRARQERHADLNDERAKAISRGNAEDLARVNRELAELAKEGSPLVHGGREPYRMWGYLRHRTVYMSGSIPPAQLMAITRARENFDREAMRQSLLDDEKTYHDQRIAAIRKRRDEVWADSQLTLRERQQYWDGADAQLGLEMRGHQRAVDEINRRFAVQPAATSPS